MTNLDKSLQRTFKGYRKLQPIRIKTNTGYCCKFNQQTSWTNIMMLLMPVSENLYKLENLILKDNAGHQLEGWMNQRNTRNRYRNQLRNFSKVSKSNFFISLLIKQSKTDSIKSICKPIQMATAENQNWKFCTQQDSSVEGEEVVLSIQGILCNRDLPPIQRPSQM